MAYITLETKREGYSVDQLGYTMTARDMIDYLEQFDDDTKIYFSNDGGYTYGTIKEDQIDYFEEDPEDEAEDEEE